MTDFKTGQRVKVSAEFDGVVSYVNMDGAVDVRPDEGSFGRTVEYIPAEYITPIVENWPPRVGDVWAVDNAEWFARRHAFFRDLIIMVSDLTSNEHHFYNEFTSSGFNSFKKLNPVLMRRK